MPLFEEARTVAQGDLSFGLNLLHHLGDTTAPISPANIRFALGMLYEGANGNTAKEIAEVARFPRDTIDQLRVGMRDLSMLLNQKDVPYNLHTANGIWINNGFELDADFKQAVTGSYDAEVANANFEGNAEGEREIINNWGYEKTAKKIGEILPQGSLDKDTRLVNVNALYFKAPWANKFDPQYTKSEDYQLPNSEVIKVDMMKKGEIEHPDELPEFMYGNFDGTQVVVLPYKGMYLGKMIVLPPKGTSLEALESELRQRPINYAPDVWFEKFSRLEIPKHTIRGNYTLNDALQKMGMEDIFDEQRANLTGMGRQLNINENLYLNRFAHQTFFQTNEEGSEGAALSAVAVAACLSATQTDSPIEFVVDRPYLEIITERRTGSILFMNRVVDPR